MNGGGWAIELERIGKRFGDRTALEGVDFRCAPGEMVAVVGASGAGKSTLLRLINGLLPASEGEARVLGQTLQSGGRLLPGAGVRLLLGGGHTLLTPLRLGWAGPSAGIKLAAFA